MIFKYSVSSSSRAFAFPNVTVGFKKLTCGYCRSKHANLNGLKAHTKKKHHGKPVRVYKYV